MFCVQYLGCLAILLTFFRQFKFLW
uniref:Uncharacterized protein n=1 Tax=Arundo donax TaxID=35708 RepID=A0A0A9FAI7_ARUDO